MIAIPTLNEQQTDAVNWVIEGHGSANVIARAGCGKTYLLVNGVVKAIVENRLGTIALTAFNKAAATEFETRIKSLQEATGNIRFDEVDTGTVHSFGFRFLRKSGAKIKVENWKVSNIIREKFGRDYKFYSQVSKLVSLAKQHAIDPTDSNIDNLLTDLLEHHDIDVNGSAAQVILDATDVLTTSNSQTSLIDFDDMIYLPVLRNIRVDQYDFVLIDEAQDTNKARRLLALKMLKTGGRLIAVGDDRQAIYGFTGADADSLDIIRDTLNSIELPLNVTYRCPKAVVAEANRIVPDLTAHESAPEGVVRSIQAMVLEEEATEDFGIKTTMTHWFNEEKVTSDDAALCRNTKPLIQEAYNFFRSGVACRVEGRDIGEGLIQLASKWKRTVTLGDLLDKLDDYKASEIQKWTEKNNTSKAQAVEDKVDTLVVIIEHLVAQGMNSIDDLTNHIKSLFGDTPEGEKPKVFTLSTIHKSKGREWNRVYILHRELMPSKYAKMDWQLHQEANLEYVAITRAKQELVWVN